MARKGEKISDETRAKMRSAALGEKNHRFGKRHTVETRKKMSESGAGKHNYWLGKRHTPEMIEARASKIRGIPCSEDKKRKISAANKGKVRTVEMRKGQSERTAARIQTGWVPSDCAKSGKFFSNKNGRELHYRSSYELRALQKLEANSEVVAFDVEVLRIPYAWSGIERYYIPDILVVYRYKAQQIIEIKAAWNINNGRIKAKFEAAKKFCALHGMIFTVWTEKDL